MMRAPLRLFAACLPWVFCLPATAQEIGFPSQVRPGNVFTVGEAVAVKAAVRGGQEVEWTVGDCRDAPVASGTAPVVDGECVVRPKIADVGYYILHLATAAGRGRTTFAVVPRFDLARMADSRYGVMTHFATGMPLDGHLLPLLAKGGIAWIRDEQPWDALEKSRGCYDFTPSLTAYMEAARKLRMNVLFDASFGNRLYDDQPGIENYQLVPYTPEGYVGFANYCAAVLQHYGAQLHCVEVWNEYNGTFCAGVAAQDRPRHYVEMLRAAYAKVKSVRPDVRVLGSAAVKIPLPYLEKLFKLGALDSMDAIAVHPYQTPETVGRSLADLTALVRRYNGGQAKPIWATECGDPDDTPDRAQAASHLVRMMTLESTFPEVERIIWYLARDFRDFPNMGLLHADIDPSGAYTPTMPFAAYANLISLLHGARFVRREKTDDRTSVYRFDNADRTVWVCWSEAGTARLNFAGPVQRLSIVGSKIPAANGGAVVIDTTPMYIVARAGAVADVTETPRGDRLIADSLRDFSDVQGKGGWSYLSAGNDKTGSAVYDPEKAVPMRWLPSPGDWAYAWTGPGDYFTLGEEGGSGGIIDGGQGWAVLRWTSDRSGPVHVVARPHGAGQGDGVGVRVFADGKELFSRLLPPDASADIDLTPTVAQGTRLDFVITPGPGTDTNYDLVHWRVSILTPTPPAASGP